MITKNFSKLSLDITEPEYRKLKGISFSTISKFLKDGIGNFDELYEKVEKPYFTFGKIVDKLITEPDDFRSEFAIIDLPQLGPKKLECTNLLFDMYSDEYKDMNDIPPDKFIKALNKVDYFSNWSKEKRINSIMKDAVPFYNGKVAAKNKTLITHEEYKEALFCSKALMHSKQTRSFFEIKEGEEHLYQLKFKSDNLIEYPVRCMFDKIIVDHNNKTILPIDFKTTGKFEYEFKKSYMDFCYWMQANIYTMVLKDVISNDDYFKDFTILPFVFLVVNKKTLSPIVYIDRYAGQEGDRVTKYGKTIKDWRTTARELLWHMEKGHVRCPRDIYESGYVVDLDVFDCQDCITEKTEIEDYEQIFEESKSV